MAYNSKVMLERLKERLSSMTQEELSAQYENITHEKLFNRWIEKLHNLSKDRREHIIDKCIAKYLSKEYRDREWKLGYEPRESLFELLARYAEKYGVRYNDRLIVDGVYSVAVILGQGAYYDIQKMESPITVDDIDIFSDDEKHDILNGCTYGLSEDIDGRFYELYDPDKIIKNSANATIHKVLTWVCKSYGIINNIHEMEERFKNSKL